jgi:hypothetical protein
MDTASTFTTTRISMNCQIMVPFNASLIAS